MNPALATTLQYPTLPLTILLAVCIIYWIVSATGIFGDPGDGFGDGVGDTGDLTASGGITAWVDRLGLSAVPFVITLTLTVLFMWVLTYWTHFNFLREMAPALRYGLGTVVLLFSVILALVPVVLVLIPVRWLLRNMTVAKSETRTVQGHSGFVVSPYVDGTTGRVSVNTSATGVRLILDARSLSGKNYPHQTQIVVVSHDVQKGVCEVVSKEEFETPH